MGITAKFFMPDLPATVFDRLSTDNTHQIPNPLTPARGCRKSFGLRASLAAVAWPAVVGDIIDSELIRSVHSHRCPLSPKGFRSDNRRQAPPSVDSQKLLGRNGNAARAHCLWRAEAMLRARGS